MMTAAVMANTNWDPALSRLLTCLEENQHSLPTNEEELAFLSGLLKSRELNALVSVHNKIISNGSDERFHPVLSNGMQIALEVLDLFAPRTHLNPDFKEAFMLLQKPHIQGLLCAHDAISQKDYFPRLPEIPLEVDEDEESVKIVQLVKSNEPLGATIKTDEETGKIVIARIMHGGAADRSGLIHVGDEVVEVNAINVEGKTPGDVLKILQNSEGTITFKIVPADNKLGARESKVRVRAHFDYVASSDPFIPCKEAGLDFVKGDILHIVSQDDAYWWQARRESERNVRAGLIPSRALQERRILHERSQTDKSDSQPLCSVSALAPSFVVLSGCPSPPRPPSNCASRPRTKKIIYDVKESDDFDREEIPTYEEVAKLYPRPGAHRPVVLIGPPGVGRNELRRRLIAINPEKYRTPIPFTSREMRPGEVNGKEYYYVTREKMEEDVDAGKFIEYGEYKGNLYGTSAESVRVLVNAGYVCVLNPHYQKRESMLGQAIFSTTINLDLRAKFMALPWVYTRFGIDFCLRMDFDFGQDKPSWALKMLRTPQLKPYVIYIKPPSLDVLKETRSAARARSTFDENNSRGFTDDEFKDIIHSAERIEFLYSHLFDEVIINADLPTAFEQLVRAVTRLETEPMWVPASWVQ